jgi:hypothetical protein
MGIWGTGIFDNDVALDIRDAFEDAVSEGLDSSAATQRVLEEFAQAAEDFDDGPVISLALAALQLQREALQPEMRERALHIIATGEGLRSWAAVDAATLDERRQVLAQLQTRLAPVEPT